MEINLNLVIVMFGTLAVAKLVRAQNQTGFISLDCGLVPEDFTYTEATSNITYISDANFTDSGQSMSLNEELKRKFQQQMWSLRSFPEGVRNCINLNLKKRDKYLIKAGFLYGNYDNKNKLPSFDLYLGPNLWRTVEIKYTNLSESLEVIHVLTSNKLQVCFVKTGETVPFISYLELRPLRNDTYVTQRGSLMTLRRLHFSTSQEVIRFEEDARDRTWFPDILSPFKHINTTLEVDTSSKYELPDPIARSAATVSENDSLSLTWFDSNRSSGYYVYLHFAEIELLQANESREFTIISNNGTPSSPIIPPNFTVTSRFTVRSLSSEDGFYNISLERTQNSTRPPLLNGAEVYQVVEFSELDTDHEDVDAIENIKLMYGLKKLNWQGDPCAPVKYLWDGLNCSNKSSELHKITSLNLSSRGLKGPIVPSIANLTELQALDLSDNNLTGEVPAFLAAMKSLSFVNLSGNQLNDSIPEALLDRVKDGALSLILGNEGNETLCKSDSCHPKSAKSKNILAPVVASVAAAVILVAAVALFFIYRKKVQTNGPGTGVNIRPDPSMTRKERRFSYSEVQSMTNNFEKILGRGGFGVVYEGLLNGNVKVAVKVLSESSAQGYKQFKAEVELLMKVHHKNLVSLVGYCKEGGTLALIYEYMPQGDLKAHLSGKHDNRTASWASRLRILLEAVQGLEYLHGGLKSPIIHRDVKATNILLDEQFQAKLADFGLSKSFPTEGESHVSTVVAGTPGYLDPEYYATNWVTKKSDIYSFGVVLLEVITNQPVIDGGRGHIIEWIKHKVNRGDITNIVDPKLNGDFGPNTAWKVVELAIRCANTSSTQRPTMSHVVMELKECLVSEMERTHITQGIENSTDSLDLNMTFVTDISPGAR